MTTANDRLWHSMSFNCYTNLEAIGRAADIPRASRTCRSDAIDPDMDRQGFRGGLYGIFLASWSPGLMPANLTTSCRQFPEPNQIDAPCRILGFRIEAD